MRDRLNSDRGRGGLVMVDSSIARPVALCRLIVFGIGYLALGNLFVPPGEDGVSSHQDLAGTDPPDSARSHARCLGGAGTFPHRVHGGRRDIPNALSPWRTALRLGGLLQVDQVRK